MNIVELFVRLKAMGLGGKPFEIAELPPAAEVAATDLFPLLKQSGPTAYKYWGMSINASISASAGRILYLEFRQVAGVAEPATGGTAFASGTNGSPTLAYADNATSLDGNSTTVPLVSWYEFPEAISVEQVALKYGTLRQQKPADITIIASNDGAEWATVFEKSDYTAADYGGNSAAGTLLIDIGGESVSEQLSASAAQIADYVAGSGKVVTFAAVNALDPETATLADVINALQGN